MRGHEHFFGRFGRRGAGMRAGKLFSSEDLQLVVLQLLSEKPRHGYELIKAIEEYSSGVYSPSPGMIYPMLTYLEEASFAVSQVEGTKKQFQITEMGTAELEKNRDHVTKVMDQLKVYGQKMAHFQEQMEQDEATDERWAGTPREQEKREWRELKTEFHDLKHELKSALFEKLSASLEEKKRVLGILRAAIAEIRGK
ncbi:MAG: PadR family transcriptional regulator [Chthoniobacteraceae bacterium]